jgi:hypothetical protein
LGDEHQAISAFVAAVATMTAATRDHKARGRFIACAAHDGATVAGGPAMRRNACEHRTLFDHEAACNAVARRFIDSPAGGIDSSMVWNWTVRLALPALLAILAAALHVIWWESPFKPGLLDVIGTAGIVVAMLGIVVWCVCAWLGCEDEGPTPLPPAGP